MTTTNRTEVRVYREDLFCDCGAKMEFTGSSTLMHPPKYQHLCSLCRRVANVHECYPRTVYDDVQ